MSKELTDMTLFKRSRYQTGGSMKGIELRKAKVHGLGGGFKGLSAGYVKT